MAFIGKQYETRFSEALSGFVTCNDCIFMEQGSIEISSIKKKIEEETNLPQLFQMELGSDEYK